MPYFTSDETVLPNLAEEKSKCEKAVDAFLPKDYTLSSDFLNWYKKYYDSSSVECINPHFISQRSSSGNVEAFPSFLILRASLAVPFLRGLRKYYNLFNNLADILRGIFKEKNLQVVTDILRGGSKERRLQKQERDAVSNAVIQHLSELGFDRSDAQTSADRFMEFLTNYKMWGGGKSISRGQGDYYVSAVTSALKLVQASNESIARVTLLMAEHDDLYREASRIIKEQSTNNESITDNVSEIVGNNLIVYGAPGTGKSHELESQVIEKYRSHIRRVVFHSEYSYFDFVGSYKPTPVYRHDSNNAAIGEYTDSVGNKADLQGTPVIDYQFVPGPFTESLIEACNNPQQPYYLIIEEINRANAAAVFGDIFQLLDRDEHGNSKYGITPPRELKNYLSQHLLNLEGVSSPNELRIPGNLFIWATMNNADQGVMFMDSAFKRRWDFEYETISLALNEKLKTSQIIYNNETHSLLQILSSVNNKLREKRPPVPEDRLIGQFFLPEEALRSEAGIRGAFKKVLIYLWDDVLRNDRNEFFDANVDSLSYLFANYQTKDVLDIEESLKKTLSEEAQPEDHSEPDTNEFEENDGQDA